MDVGKEYPEFGMEIQPQIDFVIRHVAREGSATVVDNLSEVQGINGLVWIQECPRQITDGQASVSITTVT